VTTTAGTPGRLRVLVVDDSALIRRTLVELLARDPGIEVVDTAVDGIEALVKIRKLRPDLVTLDVMMPRLNGLKVLAHVMRENPVRVLMLSSLTQEGADTTLHALDLGAVDFVDKATLAEPGEGGERGGDLLRKIHDIAKIDPARLGPHAAAGAPPATAAAPPAEAAVREAAGAGADVVVIGTSTGGPPALQQLIPALPGDLPAGVVVVQHIPRGFTKPLAERLNAASRVRVREAAEGDIVRPGEVLVAPGAVHCTFYRRGGEVVVILSPEPADTLHRPSVDVTMTSAAAIWRSRAVGVLLTGMGSDGARGMLAVRRAGGRTIAESAESCVVYGMPKAAVELGAVDESVHLSRIAGRIDTVVRPAPDNEDLIPRWL
jgi:two-component system chemotaxis response regulator CheB